MVLSKPKCLRAKVAIKKNEVVLVPETLSIVVKQEPFGDVPPTPAHVEVKFTANNPLGADADKYKFFIAPSFSDKFLSPVGAMATTCTPGLANMQWEAMFVHEVAVVSPLGSSKAGEPASKAVSGTDVQLMVPCLVNNKKLNEGDELVYFRREGKKRDAPINASSLVPKTKQRKNE
jgi:hypothetical protein